MSPPKNAKKTKTVAYRIPPDLAAEIEAAATVENQTQTAFVITAMTERIKPLKPKMEKLK